MQAILPYLYAFLVGGAFCLIGQVLIDRTKLTPARILTCYVVLGVVLLTASGVSVASGKAIDRAGKLRFTLPAAVVLLFIIPLVLLLKKRAAAREARV